MAKISNITTTITMGDDKGDTEDLSSQTTFDIKDSEYVQRIDFNFSKSGDEDSINRQNYVITLYLKPNFHEEKFIKEFGIKPFDKAEPKLIFRAMNSHDAYSHIDWISNNRLDHYENDDIITFNTKLDQFLSDKCLKEALADQVTPLGDPQRAFRFAERLVKNNKHDFYFKDRYGEYTQQAIYYYLGTIFELYKRNEAAVQAYKLVKEGVSYNEAQARLFELLRNDILESWKKSSKKFCEEYLKRNWSEIKNADISNLPSPILQLQAEVKKLNADKTALQVEIERLRNALYNHSVKTLIKMRKQSETAAKEEFSSSNSPKYSS